MSIEYKPPKFLEKLLKFIFPRYIDETVLGDFEEEYNYVASKRSLKFAKFWYLAQIVKSIPSFLMGTLFWLGNLLSNYLINAWVGFKENKIYSFINIFSLAIGVFCCIILMQNVQDDLGHITFNENTNHKYGLSTEKLFEEGILQATNTSWLEVSLKARDFIEDENKRYGSLLDLKENSPILKDKVDQEILRTPETTLTLGRNSQIPRLNYFSIMILIIMIVSGFTFINVTVARSDSRAKEIGIKRVIRDNKYQIYRKFLIEIFFLTFIALLFAIVLIVLSLLYFNARREIGILPSYKINTAIYLGMILISLCWTNFWNLFCFKFSPFKTTD